MAGAGDEDGFTQVVRKRGAAAGASSGKDQQASSSASPALAASASKKGGSSGSKTPLEIPSMARTRSVNASAFSESETEYGSDNAPSTPSKSGKRGKKKAEKNQQAAAAAAATQASNKSEDTVSAKSTAVSSAVVPAKSSAPAPAPAQQSAPKKAAAAAAAAPVTAAPPSESSEDTFLPFIKPEIASTVALGAITFLSLFTRLYKIGTPHEIVFDEVHFGKFASYYLRREYFFDVHPPLGKMLFALAGFFLGYDGHFMFDNIGDDYYKHNVPYVGLRVFPALFSAAIAPIVYMIMADSGYSIMASALAALLVVFDNTLVGNGRLIMLDSFMLFFIMMSVWSYLRFFRLRHKEFTREWYTYLFLTGFFLSCTTGVKMVGLFTFAMIGCAVLFDLWRILDIRRGYSLEQFCHHFGARFTALIIFPFVMYLSFFYIHFAILTHTGPGDAYHTPRFQSSLIGNKMTRDAVPIEYNQNITLVHQNTRRFLSSNTDRYPLRYDDGRISSQGQVVVVNAERHYNNIWRIKPSRELLAVHNGTLPEGLTIKNGDIVQIEHLSTSTNLMTHDVASPLTPTNMEISTIHTSIEGDAARYPETLWRIEIDGGKEGDVWSTENTHVRIVNVHHKVGLFTEGTPLPAWGNGTFELNGNKHLDNRGNYWFSDEIFGRNTTDANATTHKPPVSVGFFEKFAELQGVMIRQNNALTTPHPFQSDPITWPFLSRGISFWTNRETRSQIYFLGNPMGYSIALGGLVGFLAVLFANAIANRRGLYDAVHPIIQRHLMRSGMFLFSGWLLHYLPFFAFGRNLFLHHYLPSLIFSYMMVGVLFQFAFVEEYRRYALARFNAPARALLMLEDGANMMWLGIVIVVGITFAYFAPLTYGSSGLSIEGVMRRKWQSGWDLQHQN